MEEKEESKKERDKARYNKIEQDRAIARKRDSDIQKVEGRGRNLHPSEQLAEFNGRVICLLTLSYKFQS